MRTGIIPLSPIGSVSRFTVLKLLTTIITYFFRISRPLP
uniref:Uncharacterized protein n=1 Tax=Dulem virus 31 TaxID=3145749 RepID=A0AAU8AT55_9VIRU